MLSAMLLQAQARVDAWQAECDGIRDARAAARAAKAAAEQRYDDARTQQEADAAQADARTAAADLAQALVAAEPPPPQPLSEEQELAHHMAEPMYFQVKLLCWVTACLICISAP
jgi:hypothetical protein